MWSPLQLWGIITYKLYIDINVGSSLKYYHFWRLTLKLINIKDVPYKIMIGHLRNDAVIFSWFSVSISRLNRNGSLKILNMTIYLLCNKRHQILKDLNLNYRLVTKVGVPTKFYTMSHAARHAWSYGSDVLAKLGRVTCSRRLERPDLFSRPVLSILLRLRNQFSR